MKVDTQHDCFPKNVSTIDKIQVIYSDFHLK